MPQNTTLTLNVLQLSISQSQTDNNGLLFSRNQTKYEYTVGGNSGNVGRGKNTLSNNVKVTFGPNNTISFVDANGVARNVTYSIIDTTSSSNIVLIKDSSNSLDWWILSTPDVNMRNGDKIVHNYDNQSFGTDQTSWTYKSGSNGSSLTFRPSDGRSVSLCFLKGAMIKTPHSEKAVEDVRVGDEVTVFVDGKEQTDVVSWVGQATCVVNVQLTDDESGYPVRIKKDAVAEGVPERDLLVTAEHCLFFDGKFIPARMLVNGQSIVYDKSHASYDYYHIETAKHSVIMANGVLTESYLDTGNRSSFSSGNVFFMGYEAKSWAEDAAAELCTSAEVVEPIYRNIEQRAVACAKGADTAKRDVTNNANVALLTESGLLLEPIRETNGHLIFIIAGDVQSVRILSRSSRPCDTIGPYWDDRRYFGVGVSDVHVFEWNAKTSVTTYQEIANLEGWHELDADSGMRWTTGDAFLPLNRQKPEEQAILSVKVQSGTYLLSDEAPKLSARSA
nr:Hint domain-containing protein [Neokomagataea thailandica]